MNTEMDGTDEKPIRDVKLYHLLAKLELRLEAAQSKLLSGKSTSMQRACAIDALEATAEFLSSIPKFTKGKLTSLSILLVALRELDAGNKPKLFETKAAAGRTVTALEDYLRVKTACCVAVLKSTGMPVHKARDFIASRWLELGIRQLAGENVRPIKASTIEGWERWVKAQPAKSIERRMLRSASSGYESPERAYAFVDSSGLELALWSTWKDKVPT